MFDYDEALTADGSCRGIQKNALLFLYITSHADVSLSERPTKINYKGVLRGFYKVYYADLKFGRNILHEINFKKEFNGLHAS